MRNWIIKNEKLVLRFFEIIPGFFSWNMILFPYWGIFVFPNFVAYFVLLLNVYWFYQSFLIAITSIISHTKIQASINYDWVKDLKTFEKSPLCYVLFSSENLIKLNQNAYIKQRTKLL